jgi:hypothetical protein
VNTLNDNLDSLTSGVNNTFNSLTNQTNTNTLGLQICTTISANSTSGGTGCITISVTDSTTQTLAFKVEFRSASGIAQTGVLEDVLKGLYNAPPVTLNETSANGTVVRGDYSVYWGGTQYYLGSIVFITQETSVTGGGTTKVLSFTYKSDTAPNFEVLVTPLFETSSTTTGSGPSTW